MVPLKDRLLWIEVDMGEGDGPRYRYGSGCLVRGLTVLTARHVIAGAHALRLKNHHNRTTSGSILLQAADGGADLALLRIDEPAALGIGPDGVPPIPLARVDRDSPRADVVDACHALGFPDFSTTPGEHGVTIRDTVDAVGIIPVLSHLKSGRLSVVVSQAPRPLPESRYTLGESEWAGMSGGPVVVEGMLLGVIDAHAPREGSNTISAIPLTDLDQHTDDPRRWWQHLGVRGLEDLLVVPAAQGRLSQERFLTLEQEQALRLACIAAVELRVFATKLGEHLETSDILGWQEPLVHQLDVLSVRERVARLAQNLAELDAPDVWGALPAVGADYSAAVTECRDWIEEAGRGAEQGDFQAVKTSIDELAKPTSALCGLLGADLVSPEGAISRSDPMRKLVWGVCEDLQAWDTVWEGLRGNERPDVGAQLLAAVEVRKHPCDYRRAIEQLHLAAKKDLLLRQRLLTRAVEQYDSDSKARSPRMRESARRVVEGIAALARALHEALLAEPT